MDSIGKTITSFLSMGGVMKSVVYGVGYDKVDILVIDRWRSPVSRYREETCGTARIRKVEYEPGLYPMEGVAGYDFYRLSKPIKVTTLQVYQEDTWRTVMVDDPLHTFGMMGIAAACRGRVLIAGLGLGIIIHYLNLNDDVDKIDVVEINKDVVDLISKYLDMRKTNIIIDDYRNYIRYNQPIEEYDSAVLDLWSTSPETPYKERMRIANEMNSLYLETGLIAGKVYIWGIRNPKMNPAIRKIVSEEYMEIIRESYNLK